MIEAIAVDDEPLALQVLERFCCTSGIIHMQKSFTKPDEALKYLRKFPVDLLFLDIQMPSISGLDFIKYVKQETLVVFTTAFSEYAVDGFNLDATDYLLKPFTYERFLKSVMKVQDFLNAFRQADSSLQRSIFIRADYSLIRIVTDEILYVESLDDYLKIYLVSGKIVVARMTMKLLMEKLPAREFFRVHRSFIVAIKKVEVIRNKSIWIGAAEIPIGSSYEADFFSNFKK